MGCNTECRLMYTSMKRVSIEEEPHLGKKWKGHWVEGPSGCGPTPYYWVRLADHSIAWEGKACCKWAAGCYALLAMAEKGE